MFSYIKKKKKKEYEADDVKKLLISAGAFNVATSSVDTFIVHKRKKNPELDVKDLQEKYANLSMEKRLKFLLVFVESLQLEEVCK